MLYDSRISTVALAVLVVLATTTVWVGASGVSTAQEAQTPQGYSIAIETPGELTTGENQQIGVEINNTDGDSDLFSPIVEIPLPRSATVSDEALNNAVVEFENGTTKPVNDADVQNSSFRDRDAVYLFGEDVFQGEVRTYYINMSLESAGTATLEAETRLLYNEEDSDVTARTQRDVTVKGFGNITALVERPDGSSVPGAEVQINGSQVGTGSTVAERVEGTYAVSVSASGPVTLPTFTQTIEIGDNKTVQFTVPDTLNSPIVVGEEQSAAVIPGSGDEVITQEATATRPQQVQKSFIVQTTGGETVVAIPDDDLGPVASRSPAIDSGRIEVIDRNGTTNVQITEVPADTDPRVSVRFDGFRLGDANEDGEVNRTDAAVVASAVAGNESTTQYYDVNDDGEVTAVDAMFIAQFDEGNRSADYSGGGS